MPILVPPTAAAGSNPKDATERRAMQSGTSFVTGLQTVKTLPADPLWVCVARQNTASVAITAVSVSLAAQASLSVPSGQHPFTSCAHALDYPDLHAITLYAQHHSVRMRPSLRLQHSMFIGDVM